MKNIGKILSIIIIALLVFIGGKVSVNAVAETIHLGDAKSVPEYISGLSFSDKRMTNGEHLYCLHRHASTAQNVKATLQGKTDDGITYIMSRSGNSKKDYYVKQVAVWWYLDEVKGAQNLESSIKNKSGSTINEVKKLVKEAKKAGSQKVNASIKLSTSSPRLSLQNGYYVSETVNATSTGSYTVKVSGPEGTQVTDVNGNVKNTFGAKEGFKVRVPANNAKNGQEIKVTASTSASYYQGYRYNPTKSSMQKVARIVKETTTASATTTLSISTSVVKITKVDKATDQPLAGATLVLRDWKNEVVTSWKSTTDAHVIQNLGNGTYTVEETAAPDGYKLSSEKEKFTITDSEKSADVKFYNVAEESVVTITKIDKETNQTLAGAVLVVKNSEGNEVERFTTGTESHVIKNLKEGTYTVVEVQAPAGYMINETGVQFTIDKDHLSHQITIEDYKEVVVPNTASAGIILTILGIIVSIVGVTFIKKNAHA